jgi:transcriptional regulator with XRE-family HTH domain
MRDASHSDAFSTHTHWAAGRPAAFLSALRSGSTVIGASSPARPGVTHDLLTRSGAPAGAARRRGAARASPAADVPAAVGDMAALRSRAREVNRHIAARVRERRLLLGLEQQEFAARIGVTCQQAHYYESGHTRISAARLLAMADALGVGPGYFYERLGTDRGAGLSVAQRMVVELVRNFAALPTRRDQEVVCALVRAFAKRCGGKDG